MPGGPIPLGDDGAYVGLCDSWDSFRQRRMFHTPEADVPYSRGGCSIFLILIRADVVCRACRRI